MPEIPHPGFLPHFDQLKYWRTALPATLRLIVTNGCFDLLHVGHVRYLTEARALGDLLLVGINDDAGVRQLKGPQRPLNNAADRAEVLLALRCVDAVAVFPGTEAVEFLSTARPVIYCKGGDYTPETLHPGEAAALRESGSQIHILSLVPGKSTTALADKLSTSQS